MKPDFLLQLKVHRQVIRAFGAVDTVLVTKAYRYRLSLAPKPPKSYGTLRPTTMPNAALYTFGYEGLTIEAFVQRLLAARVELIVDVRELPLSRKKGFSKNAFRERLAAAGIGYEHRPALGCPKPVRDRYRADGDWGAYTRGFLAHLLGQKEEVRDLAEVTRVIRACLVCYEADPEMCHRTYVARAAQAVGGPAVQHLTARTVFADAEVPLAA